MKNIIKIILLAIVSAALAILAEQIVALVVNMFWQKEIILDSFSHFTWFLALSALIEEISKFWAVFVIRNNFGLQKIKFVLASFLLGISWGFFEIGLVLFANPKALSALQSVNPEILISFASILVLHTLTTFLMGVFISSNIFSDSLRSLKILFFPVLIHLLFNFLIIQKSGFTNYLVLLSLFVFFLIGTTILAFNFRKLA
jgi:hypothetical protein